MIRTPIEWMTILHNYSEPKRSAVLLADLDKLYSPIDPVMVDSRARCLANAIDAVLRLETGHP